MLKINLKQLEAFTATAEFRNSQAAFDSQASLQVDVTANFGIDQSGSVEELNTGGIISIICNNRIN